MHLIVSYGSFWAGKPLIGLIKSFTNTPGFKGVKKPPVWYSTVEKYCKRISTNSVDISTEAEFLGYLKMQ